MTIFKKADFEKLVSRIIGEALFKEDFQIISSAKVVECEENRGSMVTVTVQFDVTFNGAIEDLQSR